MVSRRTPWLICDDDDDDDADIARVCVCVCARACIFVDPSY